MNQLRKEFEQKGFNTAAYQQCLHRTPAEYLRRRLRCVQAYAQGQTVASLASTWHVSQQTVRAYVHQYLSGGLAALCQPTQRARAGQLTPAQQQAFKQVLLTSDPSQVGLSGHLWTGHVMRQYLLNTYGVVYKAGIYDLLERLGLSHQKAHADYGNARLADQQAAQAEVKATLLAADAQTAVVYFDEFSISQKGSPYYGWAEKNTRPRLVTNEKKGPAPTGS